MSQPIFLAQAAPATAPTTAPETLSAAPTTPATASVTVTSSATPAYDPAAAQPPAWTNLIPILLLLAFFYFAVMRPQQKTKEAQQQLLKKLKPGDRAVTSGGILGVISAFEDNETVVVLRVSDNTKIRVKRDHIAEVVNEAKETKEIKDAPSNETTVMKDSPRDMARNKKPGGQR